MVVMGSVRCSQYDVLHAWCTSDGTAVVCGVGSIPGLRIRCGHEVAAWVSMSNHANNAGPGMQVMNIALHYKHDKIAVGTCIR